MFPEKRELQIRYSLHLLSDRHNDEVAYAFLSLHVLQAYAGEFPVCGAPVSSRVADYERPGISRENLIGQRKFRHIP